MTSGAAATRTLQRRLAEAEATIQALLSGQIDAVVDAKSRTPVLLAKAQEALRQERDRAQRYLDTPEVILLALDMEGRITLVSRYACTLLGWTVDELLGRDWIATCLPAVGRDKMAEVLSRLLAGNDADVIENAVVTRSGHERLIEWRNTLLRDDAGRVTGTFSCGNDITERRKSEAALYETTAELQRYATALGENEERTTYALAAARMGLWSVDLVTQRVTWSETMAGAFGLRPDQAPSTTDEFLSLVHPDDRRMVEDAFQSAVRCGTDYHVEFRAIWPDGTMHWHDDRARVRCNELGHSLSVLGVNTDISERKSLEAQFRQAQKMEAVGQLAGGVAHDFNNLLTAILGYSNLVVDTFQPSDPRRADLEEVIDAGRRAAGLTTQLLAFSRKQVLQPIAVDVNALVAGMRQMLSRLIGEQVDFAVSLAADLGAVRADPGQLEQVLMNLVVNASDAMPSGGRLVVETANVHLDQTFMPDVTIYPGPYVMLAVTDSGMGMTEATRRRLFEPFFTTKPVGKGTGLGLATVYGIVKQSGGYVWAFSEIDQGATFKVFLPRIDDDARDQDLEGSGEAAATGTETILVVEDEKAVRSLTCRILESAGYRVFEASNPDQAVLVFEERGNLINLLVTDVIMPGSSGPSLFERLARQRPDLQVLYVSGYTDDKIVHQGQLAPGVAFLQKPYTAAALKGRVRQILNRLP